MVMKQYQALVCVFNLSTIVSLRLPFPVVPLVPVAKRAKVRQAFLYKQCKRQYATIRLRALTTVSKQRCSPALLQYRLSMDKQVHVPVDDPHADTEWYVFSFAYLLRLTEIVQERYSSQAWHNSRKTPLPDAIDRGSAPGKSETGAREEARRKRS